MYPLRIRISIINPWLFPDWTDCPTGSPAHQAKKKPQRGKPAFILSQDAVLNEMDLRQALKEPLEHPQDLWRYENLEKIAPKLAFRVHRGRNGVPTHDGIALMPLVPTDILERVQNEEEKTAQAVRSLRLLEQLEEAAVLLRRAIKNRRGNLEAAKNLHQRATAMLEQLTARS